MDPRTSVTGVTKDLVRSVGIRPREEGGGASPADLKVRFSVLRHVEWCVCMCVCVCKCVCVPRGIAEAFTAGIRGEWDLGRREFGRQRAWVQVSEDSWEEGQARG